jgi:hypothetical protein
MNEQSKVGITMQRACWDEQVKNWHSNS